MADSGESRAPLCTGVASFPPAPLSPSRNVCLPCRNRPRTAWSTGACRPGARPCRHAQAGTEAMRNAAARAERRGRLVAPCSKHGDRRRARRVTRPLWPGKTEAPEAHVLRRWMGGPGGRRNALLKKRGPAFPSDQTPVSEHAQAGAGRPDAKTLRHLNPPCLVTPPSGRYGSRVHRLKRAVRRRTTANLGLPASGVDV